MPNLPEKHNITIRIHSYLADCGTLTNRCNSVMLWYLVRAWDTSGSGWSQFKLEDAASALNRSLASIRRYLKQGIKLGFFRVVTVQGSTVKVFYQSLFKVCQSLGLSNWGGVAEIEVSDLNNLRLIATQIEAQRLQECSRYNASKEHRNIIDPDELLSSSQCSRGARDIIYRGNRCLFVNENFAVYGATQETIGERMNRCDRTIRRRLSNQHRVKHGLEPLDRLQIAQTSSDLNQTLGAMFDECDRSELSAIDGIHRSQLSDRIFKMCGSVYRSICNVYERSIDLISMRRSRSLFNRLKQSSFIKDSLQDQALNKSGTEQEEIDNNRIDRSSRGTDKGSN